MPTNPEAPNRGQPRRVDPFANWIENPESEIHRLIGSAELLEHDVILELRKGGQRTISLDNTRFPESLRSKVRNITLTLVNVQISQWQERVGGMTVTHTDNRTAIIAVELQFLPSLKMKPRVGRYLVEEGDSPRLGIMSYMADEELKSIILFHTLRIEPDFVQLGPSTL